MVERRFKQVGLDRLVRLDWLEKTASLALAGVEAREVTAILQDSLGGAFQSDRKDVRGSLDKTITILTKVWILVPGDLEQLRQDGLELMRRMPLPERKALHWGMVMAVYPFWSNVAMQVGRLLNLQGTAAATQVQRRLREQYGERELVSRRVRYVLRSFVDWGVLKETGDKGVYGAGSCTAVNDIHLVIWLAEAFLQSRPGGSFPLKDLFASPILFPFKVKAIRAENLVAASIGLDILRHGLDDDLIMLKERPAKHG